MHGVDLGPGLDERAATDSPSLVGSQATLVLELNKTALGDGWLFALAEMNFLHFAIFLFATCSALLVLVSLATAATPRARLADLTYATTDRAEPEDATAQRTRRVQIALSLGVTLLVGLIWAWFRG